MCDVVHRQLKILMGNFNQLKKKTDMRLADRSFYHFYTLSNTTSNTTRFVSSSRIKILYILGFCLSFMTTNQINHQV